MSRFTLASAAVLATLIAAACGQSTTAVPPPSSTPGGAAVSTPAAASATATGAPATAPATPAPTVAAPTESPAPSAAPTRPVASGEDLSGYTDLRQLIPDRVGEVAMVKTLYTPADFAAYPQSVSDQMRTLLEGLAREPGDLTMAVAGDANGAADLTITAFRVRDIQADRFFEVYVPLVMESFPSAAINKTQVGGKTVYDVSLDGQTAGTTFLYPRDDVLFIVTGSDLELVNLAFAALP